MTFTCTGAPVQYALPSGVTSVFVDVRGGSGADAVSPRDQHHGVGGGVGDRGGRVLVSIPTGGRSSLDVHIGCDGPGSDGGWGFAVGGDGDVTATHLSANGGGGGGASAIVAGGTALVVAGGGGGGGGNNLATNVRLGGAGGVGGSGPGPSEPPFAIRGGDGANGGSGEFSYAGPGSNAGGRGGASGQPDGADGRVYDPNEPRVPTWGGGG